MQITVSLETPTGGCPACRLKVEPGTTAEVLFHQAVGGEPADYRVVVNGNPVPWEYVLQDEDRVRFTAPPR